ncbi:Uncharacterized protein APZ42_033939 [Daphnia magna]|uniref:Uncharacterized protein n=1 Tax=Daphnia magna TaxID=35525 RepID=A0A164KL41_9CRUS|nr:Uncharacterized protein APZ42_033939 [Daphnia magna]
MVNDATTTSAQKIHELRRKIDKLQGIIMTIKGLDTAIFDETDAADLVTEIDAADNNNRTLHDAKEGFDFQLRTLQDAEDAVNAANAPAPPANATAPVPSDSALPKLDLPIFKGDILLCRFSLRAFADQLKSHTRGLEALGTAPTSYGELLVCLLVNKLAINVRRNLTRHRGNTDWYLDELRAAIKREIEIMGDTPNLLPSSSLAFKQVFFTSFKHPKKTKHSFGPKDGAKVAETAIADKKTMSHFHCQRCHQPHHTSLHNEKGTSTQSKPTSSHTGCVLSIASSKGLPAEEIFLFVDTKYLPFVFLKTAVATVSSHLAFSHTSLLIDPSSRS